MSDDPAHRLVFIAVPPVMAHDLAAAQAVLASGDSVRDFLKANEVTATGTSTDAKAAVVRVICVRK